MTNEDAFKEPSLPSSDRSLSPDPPPADPVNSAASSDSAAESLPPGIPYSVPEWSGPCRNAGYRLEVLKNGVILTHIDLMTRATHVLGRLSACHVPMEHPSLSRFHAVLQHRAVAGPGKPLGWYLIDLKSSHGTWVNKVKVRPMEFHRLRVGHVLKFGGSSRLYVLHGPDEDREPESDISYSQFQAAREKAKAMAEELRLMAEKAKEEERAKAMCSWGISDDAVDEEEEVREMADEPAHEELYIKDPKKALRAYFEREGFDQPEYEFLDAGFGKHHCRVELLPLQTVGSGRSTFAEALVSGGKKKEAVTACALEACRMLDRMGELVKAASSRAQRRLRDWEANEFYDSDEDTFLDRTGDIERKRARRMAQAGKAEEAEAKADTFESLTAEFAALGEQIRAAEAKLEQSRKQLQGGEQPAGSELDALDAYMAGIRAGALDRRSRMALKMRLTEMRRQSEALKRRLQAAAPNLSVLAMRAAATARPAAESQPSDAASERSEEETATDPDAAKVANVATGRMRFSIRSAATTRPALPKSALPTPDDFAAAEEEEEEETESPKKEETKAPFTPPPTSSPAPLREEEKERSTAPKLLPARPPCLEETAEESAKEERRRKRKRQRAPAPAPTAKEEEEFPDDPDYVCWMPPENQTGDGTTALNSRFGY